MARQSKKLSVEEVRTFRRLVYQFYRRFGRQFPWRETSDPYRILVSEIMLQQTQTDRVVDKYKAFLLAFPTIKSLAKAPLRQVLKLWQGLGYNRRALALHRLASVVVKNHNGHIPLSETDLMALPGIGPYTAAAIRTFAFKQPTIVIETNIRTVFIHHFFPRGSKIADDALVPLITQALDHKQPARWYSALMDYGAWLKKEHGNSSRRSKQYVRQSKFAGSNRQLRGQVIALVTGTSSVTLKRLQLKLEQPVEKIDKVVAQLCRDGFLVRRGHAVSIAH